MSRTLFLRGMFLVLTIYAGFAFYRLGWADLQTDEGRFGISALNILRDYHQLATVSEDPLGGPGTKPYLYPLCLAASLLLLGRSEFALRAVSAVALASSGVLLGLLIASVFNNRRLAILATGLFLLNPWTISYARSTLPEALLMLWGCLALFAATRFFQTETFSSALLCGFALGCGIVTKLWLVAPFGLACGVILGAKLRRTRNPRILHALIGSGLIFVAMAGSHLFLVASLRPEELAQWQKYYYFLSFRSRIAGAASEYDPSMWYKPWWFYFAGAFKSVFFALPALLLGIYQVAKSQQFIVMSTIAALLSPFLLFSMLLVKQTSYVYPAFVAVAFLLAVGLIHFLEDGASRRAIFSASLASLGTLAAAFIFRQVSWIEALMIGVLYGAFLLWSLIPAGWQRFPKALVIAAVISALLVANGIVVRKSLEHRVYYREVSAFLKDRLFRYPPSTPVFTAPEYAAFEFYTFRSGEYWHTYHVDKRLDVLDRELAVGSRVFYVVDPGGALYGGRVSPEELSTLEEHASNLTSRIEQRFKVRLPFRVYSPRALMTETVGSSQEPASFLSSRFQSTRPTNVR